MRQSLRVGEEEGVGVGLGEAREKVVAGEKVAARNPRQKRMRRMVVGMIG